MLNENEKVWNEYVLSRDTVQLINVDNISLSVSKKKRISSMQKKNIGISMNKLIKKFPNDNTYLNGILEAEIQVFNEAEESCAIIRVVQLGTFHTESALSEEEFRHRVDLQLVPQLLPYLRGVVSVLASETGLAPLVMPTMDILKSLKTNKKHA